MIYSAGFPITRNNPKTLILFIEGKKIISKTAHTTKDMMGIFSRWDDTFTYDSSEVSIVVKSEGGLPDMVFHKESKSRDFKFLRTVSELNISKTAYSTFVDNRFRK